MPRLFLLRHAKSSPAGPGQKDFDRPLNGRGRVAAAAVGRFMVDSGLQPDRILWMFHATFARLERGDVARATAIWAALNNEDLSRVPQALRDALDFRIARASTGTLPR